jgi:hypothetical protein
LHVHTSSSDWIADSGCTHHMATDVSLLSALNTNKNCDEKVYIKDDNALSVYGTDNVRVENGVINQFIMYQI